MAKLYFYEFNCKKSANFNFQKIIGTINFFFKFAKTFLLHQRTINCQKERAKTVFDLKNSKKGTNFVSGKTFKNVNETFFCLLILGIFRHFLRPCEALRQVKKIQFKVKFWIWGPRTVYYIQLDICPNFFLLKNHSTL